MTTALIDGDILVYRCGFAVQKTEYAAISGEFVEGIWDAHKNVPQEFKDSNRVWKRTTVEPVENALQATKAALEGILEKLQPDNYEIYLSGRRSFREKLAVTLPYKGNRELQEKPKHYNAIRDYLCGSWGASTYLGNYRDEEFEADDILGIRLTVLGGDGICVSIDKDLLQIPGRHYNWVMDQHLTVSPKDGSLSLGVQILAGDRTDNVPGLAGIGEAKARKLLAGSSNPRDMFARIRQAYGDHYKSDGTGEVRFRETGNLVYVLRSPDDSFDNYVRKYESP